MLVNIGIIIVLHDQQSKLLPICNTTLMSVKNVLINLMLRVSLRTFLETKKTKHPSINNMAVWFQNVVS